jgi:hypothetical protein
MNLAKFVADEMQVQAEQIMLLRHSNSMIAKLRQFGALIEEYTCIQPADSPYDFSRPDNASIVVVVVIVDDRVYGIYQVAGVEAEGTNYDLGNANHQAFERHENNNVPPLPCRRFQLIPVASVVLGLSVSGWNAPIQTILKSHAPMFHQISILLPDNISFQEAAAQAFEDRVVKAAADTPIARKQRLMQAKRVPNRVSVTSNVFARNADVVAEVLFRANGVCQECHNPAPFNRRSDNSPYLEVHHIKTLAAGGEDTVENAIALCPNCHRKMHYA